MICVIKECISESVKTGLCSTHYKRRRIGNYSIGKNIQINGSFIDKLNAYTKKSKNKCLIWTGPIYPNQGYGRVNYKGERITAHRATYDFFKGIKNKKSHIHHKCENKLCVEITHLEEVSHSSHSKKHFLERRIDNKGRLMPHKNS